MDFGLLLRGLMIGFAIAAPVGPIGMLVVRRTLAEGCFLGLLTGLGAAVADAAYGSVGAFGLTFISNWLLAYMLWAKLLGGLFLCYLGFTTFREKPRDTMALTSSARYFGAFGSTLLLTLTNPVTILSFVAIFAGLGLGTNGRDYGTAGFVVAGVFLGSVLWWLLLSSGVSLLRRSLRSDALKWINAVSALFLFVFGLTALGSALISAS